MKKKHLYYTILTIAFIVLFVLDVLILGALNVKSGFLMALGAAIVLSLFGSFKTILKEHPYFRDIKKESESSGLDDELLQDNVVNTSQVEEKEQLLVHTDENVPTPNVNIKDAINWKPTGGENRDSAKVSGIVDCFMRWNAKYYISINTFILIALIAFLYVLPVDYSPYYKKLFSISENVYQYHSETLSIYYYAVFFLAAIGLIMNWGHYIVKNKRSWLYLFNIAVQVFISMMYILAYLKWRSDYWGYLIWPIICSLYICMISNRLMKENNQ